MEVKSVLDDMHKDVVGMSECVQSMADRLQSTKTRTMQLIEQTSKLQNERFESIGVKYNFIFYLQVA